MASNEITATISVKDTDVFIALLNSSSEFHAWFNRTYQIQPSNHPDHPWCKLGKLLQDLSDDSVEDSGEDK